jgi:cysteine desulfurase/selenocysteine lyase
VDVRAIGCDYLCFSGHKMLGPTGTGVLWMKEPDLTPMLLGGGMIREVTTDGYTPEDGYAGLEAGTPNVTGAIGLRKAVQILSGIGMDEIFAHETALTGLLLDGLSGIEGVTLFGPDGSDKRVGTVSFLIDGYHPHEAAHLLDDQYDTMVRSGHHCCMPLMEHLGCPDGTIRASLYLYNTADEVEFFTDAVREIAEGI